MSFRTDAPIEAKFIPVKNTSDTIYGADGVMFNVGPFRSIIYANEGLAVVACAERFPTATVGGKPIAEAYPAAKDVKPAPKPVPDAAAEELFKAEIGQASVVGEKKKRAKKAAETGEKPKTVVASDLPQASGMLW